MSSKLFVLSFFLLSVGLFACVQIDPPNDDDSMPSVDNMDYGGGAADKFKVPVPPGFDWEITQSWAKDCEECSRAYGDWDYCSLSHSSYSIAKYGWDFNLPGNADFGKAVLASADGYVREEGHDNSWGNYVVLDHGQNVCSRYAHLADRSKLDEDEYVCQGMRVGKVGNTGASDGAHLHFQFEDCNTGQSIAKSFTDGNGRPKCIRGQNRYDSNGNYDFLTLNNFEKTDCSDDVAPFGDAELNDGGWVNASCGSLNGCPLIPNCSRQYGHRFDDHYSLSSAEADASAYLWSECALDGKSDGGLHPNDEITRAEALKIPMFLYGTMDRCGASASEPFSDVDSGDWYFGVVACAVTQGLISNVSAYFRPNASVSFAEAAKFVVEPAIKAGVIHLKNPSNGHFKNIPKGHWAYKYAETLYEYGGITGNAGQIWPDDTISRGDYVVMVASLSPCFCRNVSCMGGCVCKQDLMACVDKNDNSSGTGGTINGEPMSPPDDDPPPSNPPPSNPPPSNPPPSNPPPSNPPPSDPPPSDPPPSDPPPSNPPPSDPPPSDPPPSNPPPSNPPPSNPPPSDPPPSNPPPSNPPPSDPTWQCVPNHTYQIQLWIISGDLDIKMSGPISSYQYLFDGQHPVLIEFDCADLPASILATSYTNEMLNFSVMDSTMTPFAVWENYNGPLVIDPPTPYDFFGTVYNTFGVGGSVLLRFPAEN